MNQSTVVGEKETIIDESDIIQTIGAEIIAALHNGERKQPEDAEDDEIPSSEMKTSVSGVNNLEETNDSTKDHNWPSSASLDAGQGAGTMGNTTNLPIFDSTGAEGKQHALPQIGDPEPTS